MTGRNGVRAALPGDAAGIGRVQLDCWRTGYRDLIPPELLAGWTESEFAAGWLAATKEPPSERHRVLVATDLDTVAGFAALGPATDPDRDPARDGELYVLAVAPEQAGRGHGSRLLAAAADHLRADGFHTAVSWLLDAEEALAAFLARSGWAPDGSRRQLEPGPGMPLLAQLRLHTDLGPADAATP